MVLMSCSNENEYKQRQQREFETTMTCAMRDTGRSKNKNSYQQRLVFTMLIKRLKHEK